MATEKLYYEDSRLVDFAANVVSCRQTKNGWAVTLDKTAFYPEGGGQPCDLGVLGDATVTDVQEEGEEVVHYCDKPLSGPVTGQVDWERRLDLMQQHTGEHILSGIICSRYGANNVGFHIGADTVTIDFDVPIPQEDLPELEWAANRAVWDDVPIICAVPDPQALAAGNYRSKKALEGPVRLVTVTGYDCCACCGTHFSRAGQVGMIKILSAVKFHQGVRMEILCGKRALGHYQKVWEQTRQVSAAFSAKPLETGAAANRMNQQLAEEKFRSAGLQKQLFAAVAQGYRDAGNVVHFAENLIPGAVRELADALSHVCGGIATVLSGNDETGYSLCLISKDTDVRPLGNAAVQALDGRGGGKPGAFQGSLKASRRQIEAFFAGR